MPCHLDLMYDLDQLQTVVNYGDSISNAKMNNGECKLSVQLLLRNTFNNFRGSEQYLNI